MTIKALIGLADKYYRPIIGLNLYSFLLIHESPLTDTLFLLVSKSDEVTTT